MIPIAISRAPVALVLSATLTACGGSGSSDPLPAAVATTVDGADGTANSVAGADDAAPPFDDAAEALGEPAPAAAGSTSGAPPAPSHEPKLELALDGLDVSSSQYVAYQTPIAAARGAVYIANVEPGADGDEPGFYQRTIVRRGVRDGAGAWRWSAFELDDRTIHDRWHGPPGLAVDRDGFVHVGFNMHNFPWQYAVSNAPDSIDGFRFLGEPITDAELDRHVFENRTNFKTQGIAAIPGTQITYPAFHRDAADELWVSYRQAARPARAYADRTMSGAVARYDAGSRTWSAVGGALALAPGDAFRRDGAEPRPPTVVAGRTGWTVYTPSLEVDGGGRLHVMLFWRQGTAGPDLTRPCVVVRHGDADWRHMDGSPVALPLQPDDCTGDLGVGPEQRFLSVTDTAMDAAGRLHVVLSPIASDERWLIAWDGTSWRRSALPQAAGTLFFDAENSLWAVTSGPVVFRRRQGESGFTQVLDRPTGGPSGVPGCLTHAALEEQRRVAYLHVRGCNTDTVDIYRLEMLPR